MEDVIDNADRDLIEELAALTDPEEPEVVEAEPELPEMGQPEFAQPKDDEPPKTSGTLVLKYTRSVVKRDEAGRIIEIIGPEGRKIVKRDVDGRIMEIIEESESEL